MKDEIIAGVSACFFAVLAALKAPNGYSTFTWLCFCALFMIARHIKARS
jgi:hypothetical protein